MRGDINRRGQSDQSSAAFVFDPSMFVEDTGEREEYNSMLRFNARPHKESRPLYVGPDGKLHQQINRNDPQKNRMQHILTPVGNDLSSSLYASGL